MEISTAEYELMQNMIRNQTLVITLLQEAREADNNKILELKKEITRIRSEIF